MDLYYFHRVLISSAVLFFLGFALYSHGQFRDLADRRYLLMAVGSGAACVAMVGYLVYFNMATRRLYARHRRSANP